LALQKFIIQMKNLLFPILFLAITTGCASNPEQLSDQVQSNEEESEKICRYEKVVGTRIPERFCYTKEELERLEEASQKMLEKEQRMGERRQTQETLGNSNPG
jgi:hypothetical protein